MKSRLLAMATATLLISGAGLATAQETPWIHIRVTDGDDTKVSVNLPMSLIEVAMDIAEDEILESDHGLHFGRHKNIDLDDLRKMWAELRDGGDAEYVTVDDDGEQVKIWRQSDKVFVSVTDEGEKKVDLQVPFSVVDTLLQGEGNELNLVAAVREMAKANNGEIIQVNDGDTNVRIWIDNSNQD